MTLFICLKVQNIFLLSCYISLFTLTNTCISFHVPFFDRFLFLYMEPVLQGKYQVLSTLPIVVNPAVLVTSPKHISQN